MRNLYKPSFSEEQIRLSYLKYANPTTKQNKIEVTDQEVELVVLSTVNKYQGSIWLEEISLDVIRDVVSNVKYLRQSNQNITDRDIYIDYSYKIQQTNEEFEKKRLTESLIILQAMMGGHISGKLPF